MNAFKNVSVPRKNWSVHDKQLLVICVSVLNPMSLYAICFVTKKYIWNQTVHKLIYQDVGFCKNQNIYCVIVF